MKSADYWKKRFELLEASQNKQGQECFKHIENQYKRCQRELEQSLNAWYQRLADNNIISMAEARKMLTSKELEEFKWDVNDYIKYGRENAIDQSWMKELENASSRYHISRLEAIKLQMQQSIEKLYGNQLDTLDKSMRKIYKDGYMHTAYEVQRGFNVGWDFSTLNQRKIDKVINNPWAVDGSNFSQRIWRDKKKLVNELNNSLTRNIILGSDPQNAIDEISRSMNVSKSSAGRLVMTEQAYFSSVAQQDSFKDLDVEEYQILATLDSRTSKMCRNMDGKVFKLNEFEVGVTAPPFHCYCRTTRVPYFNDEFTQDEIRAARNEKGKTYYVPSYVTYNEWSKMQGYNDSNLKNDIDNGKIKAYKEIISKISSTNSKLKDLKTKFSEVTEGYSYEEWYHEFDSIEDGFGIINDRNRDEYNKIKKLDDDIKKLYNQKNEFLLKKESREQLKSGFGRRVPNDKLEEFNIKAFDQIKIDTGLSDNEVEKLQNAMISYFGDDYDTILTKKTNITELISNGIDLLPRYEGSIYRGLGFTDERINMFTSLKKGDILPNKSIISSWTCEKKVSYNFGDIKNNEADSVIIECIDNKKGVGVQHISKHAESESEVLSNCNYEVVDVSIESKYEFLSKHKNLLYYDEFLEEYEDDLKGRVVCKIKVKENNFQR